VKDQSGTAKKKQGTLLGQEEAVRKGKFATERAARVKDEHQKGTCGKGMLDSIAYAKPSFSWKERRKRDGV